MGPSTQSIQGCRRSSVGAEEICAARPRLHGWFEVVRRSKTCTRIARLSTNPGTTGRRGTAGKLALESRSKVASFDSMRLLLIFIIACIDPAPPVPTPTPTPAPAPTPPPVPEIEPQTHSSLPVLRLEAFPSGLRALHGDRDLSTPLSSDTVPDRAPDRAPDTAPDTVPSHRITSLFADGVLPVAVVWHDRNVLVWVLDIARSDHVMIQPAFSGAVSVRHPPSGTTTRDWRLLDVDGDGARDLVAYRTRMSDVGAHTVRRVHRYRDGTFREDRSLTQRAPRNARPWRGELRQPADVVARALEVPVVTLGPPVSLASTSFETPASVGIADFGAGEFFAGREIVARVEVGDGFQLAVLRETTHGFEVLSHRPVPGRRGPLPSPDVFEAMDSEARRALDDPCVRSGPFAIEVVEGGPRGMRAVVWRHALEGRQHAVVFTWDVPTLARHSTHDLGAYATAATLSITATEDGPQVELVSP